ncbi:MAG: hypothetical protein JWR23_2149 [Mucilaginibacter sp.]|nr:hypothetical protein [Mucilaginibacter sp.]
MRHCEERSNLYVGQLKRILFLIALQTNVFLID